MWNSINLSVDNMYLFNVGIIICINKKYRPFEVNLQKTQRNS